MYIYKTAGEKGKEKPPNYWLNHPTGGEENQPSIGKAHPSRTGGVKTKYAGLSERKKKGKKSEGYPPTVPDTKRWKELKPRGLL